MLTMSRAAFVAALAVASVFFTAGASADIFRITGVRTEAEAATAAAAQEPALALGYAKALEELVDRLTLPRDRVLIPPATPAIASDLVAGHEVLEQANTATKYIATISVTFDPQRVRDYFRTLGVQHVESRTRPMLVVPLWRDGAGVRLWRDNAWLQAWQSREFSDELIPLFAPLGDISDISGTSAAAVSRLDRASLSSMARRYNLERILVAFARGTPGAYSVELRELDFAQSGQPVSRGVASGASLEGLRDSVFRQFQSEWKRSLNAAVGVKTDIVLSVRYDSLPEWRRLEEGIGGAALLSDVQLEALTNDGAMLRASFRGAVEQLRLELRERGLALTPSQDVTDGASVWQVQTLERASRTPAPSATPGIPRPSGAPRARPSYTPQPGLFSP